MQVVFAILIPAKLTQIWRTSCLRIAWRILRMHDRKLNGCRQRLLFARQLIPRKCSLCLQGIRVKEEVGVFLKMLHFEVSSQKFKQNKNSYRKSLSLIKHWHIIRNKNKMLIALNDVLFQARFWHTLIRGSSQKKIRTEAISMVEFPA